MTAWKISSLVFSLGIALGSFASAQQVSAPDSSDDDNSSKLADDPKPVTPPEGLVPSELVNIGIGEFYSPYALLVDKSSRTLTVWRRTDKGLRLVSAYPTDMGKKNGDKHFLGDHRTPEGVYFFQEMYEGPNLDFNNYGVRAFTMDYPNFFDKRERKTGSGIWLHAIPETKTLQRGSRGCVVVRNDVIRTLSQYITLTKTPIVVQDKVTYVEPTLLDKEKVSILTWLDGWRESWSMKDLDSYISYYGDDFKSLGMGKKQWRNYKKALNSKYHSIQVRIQRPVIYRHDNEVVVRFLQNYQSDMLTDFGEKYLYIRKSPDGNWKIVGEKWVGLKNDLLANKFKNSANDKL